jgi:hypothetical protein
VTEREALLVVQRLVGWWPHSEMPAPTVALWVSKLVELNAASAIAAVDGVAAVTKYLPTWGEFAEAYAVANRPRPKAWDARTALPSTPLTDPDDARRYVADIRAALAAAKGPLVRGLQQAVSPPDGSLRERIRRIERPSRHLPTFEQTYPPETPR